MFKMQIPEHARTVRACAGVVQGSCTGLSVELMTVFIDTNKYYCYVGIFLKIYLHSNSIYLYL